MPGGRLGLDELTAMLAGAGCVAAAEEAADLVEAAAGDDADLRRMAARRVAGEPLAWVTGWIDFAGHRVTVHPGVYVPRRQSEALARRAAELLPARGLAADLCTGSGAVAVVLAGARPGARVVATDADPAACRCAAANGVDVHLGDLADPLPGGLAGRFDVVVAVVPYVPTDQIGFLPTDARDHEPLAALDGGPGGTRVLERAVVAAAGLLRPGGTLLLELGGDQDLALGAVLAAAGYGPLRRHLDDDGDLRAIEASLRRAPPTPRPRA